MAQLFENLDLLHRVLAIRLVFKLYTLQTAEVALSLVLKFNNYTLCTLTKNTNVVEVYRNRNR